MSMYLITYPCDDGRSLERQISNVSLSGEWTIYAFCHLRQSMRSFSIARIERIVNLDSGEIADSPYRAFGFHLGPTGKEIFASAFWSILPAIKTLTFFAKSTGKSFKARELAFIVGFARAHAEVSGYSNESIGEWIKTLWCGDPYAYMDGDTHAYDELRRSVPRELLPDCRFVALQIARRSGRAPIAAEILARIDNDFSA